MVLASPKEAKNVNRRRRFKIIARSLTKKVGFFFDLFFD
jgi:hypothetical protein